MKSFHIERSSDGTVIAEVAIGDRRYSLNPRLDLRQHSPTGFEYGYAGSGPAQLALAILVECFTTEVALQWYQQYKLDYVMHFKDDRLLITEESIRSWASLKGFLVSDSDHGGSQHIHGEERENL